ncbi:MAG: phosphate acyltransferase PlsX [Patescibacteria group bacterium]|nr:phosphate acyltransferase PlsX [Patescibacteria group bacterium]MDD5715846.1 phosphate acyltransferase PlsX [Patescibacteria group bacterium]
MPQHVRIAVDAMGGDFYPSHPVHGALLALKELPGDFSLVLIGDKAKVEQELGRHKHNGTTRLSIHHTTQVVEPGDQPGDMLRNKLDSSMHVGLQLVRDGAADAFLSAGNTGALLAVALRRLQRIEGIRRPALAATFPTLTGNPSLVLDVGANADCKPVYLEQFAVMGAIYARLVLGFDSPRVGLINVGSERGKGNELTQKVHQLLVRLSEDGKVVFSGNIEGNRVFSGECNVLVTDGFTGNIVLKMAEGFKPTMEDMLRQIVRSGHLSQKIFALIGGKIFLKSTIGSLKRAFDYQRYGGVPLLGVNGVVIKAHGRSTPEAFKHAIAMACKEVNAGIVSMIHDQMQNH